MPILARFEDVYYDSAMSSLVSRNPATGELILEVPLTSHDHLPVVFEQAKQAQHYWNALGAKKRAQFLIQLRETILNRLDSIVDLIHQENGKPKFEALSSELLPILDTLTLFAKRGPKWLKNTPIHLELMRHRKSYLNYWPLGMVLVISPWNYPFLLPLAQIAMALLAGNSVVFKPSEATSAIGLRIQELCNEAGLPPYVLQTVIGNGSLGEALIDHKPGKIFFTGSAATGRKVMSQASRYLIPVNLELGGKEALIVLPDADLDFASSAALWGGFSNSGQVCASVERIFVHQSVAEDFGLRLKEKAERLRAGQDLGVITLEKQKKVYEDQLSEAKTLRTKFLTGGEFSADHRSLSPTVITGLDLKTSKVYREETFGPIVTITPFQSISEAIAQVNESEYGLLSGIITKNLSLGKEIAKQLEVGTVTINEVIYTAALGETPWGGVKQSGFGRTHSQIGLYEFVNVRHIHQPRMRIFTFKSFWWFPYTPFQYSAFRHFCDLYRLHWIDKIKAFPMFLWNFLQFIKTEKRL